MKKTYLFSIVLLLGFVTIVAIKLTAATPEKSYSQSYEYIVIEMNRCTYQIDDERRKETIEKYPKQFQNWTYGAVVIPSVDQATTLNELGKLGWEFITMNHSADGRVFGYFKRKI